MNEFEIFLLSDIGECYLGTVEDSMNDPDSIESVLNEIKNFISDVAVDIAFGDDLKFSKTFTVELRKPR